MDVLTQLRQVIDTGLLLKLNNAESRVWLVYMVKFRNSQNEAWPSNAEVAELAGVSARTVERARARMRELGIIETGKRGRRRVKFSAATPPPEAESPPPVSEKSAMGGGQPATGGGLAEPRTAMGVGRTATGGGRSAMGGGSNEQPKVTAQRNKEAYPRSDVKWPAKFDKPSCRRAWRRWLDHKLAKRDQYATAASESSALTKLANYGWTVDEFCHHVDHSIAEDWKGVYPDRNYQAPPWQDIESVEEAIELGLCAGVPLPHPGYMPPGYKPISTANMGDEA